MCILGRYAPKTCDFKSARLCLRFLHGSYFEYVLRHYQEFYLWKRINFLLPHLALAHWDVTPKVCSSRQHSQTRAHFWLRRAPKRSRVLVLVHECSVLFCARISHFWVRFGFFWRFQLGKGPSLSVHAFGAHKLELFFVWRRAENLLFTSCGFDLFWLSCKGSSRNSVTWRNGWGGKRSAWRKGTLQPKPNRKQRDVMGGWGTDFAILAWRNFWTLPKLSAFLSTCCVVWEAS